MMKYNEQNYIQDKIVIGIKCDIEGSNYHVLVRDELIFMGNFSALHSSSIIFESIFNLKSPVVKYMNSSVIVFELTDLLIEQYNELMRYKSVFYAHKNSFIKQISENTFKTIPYRTNSANIKCIAFFDDDFKLIENINSYKSCIIVLKDISSLTYGDIFNIQI